MTSAFLGFGSEEALRHIAAGLADAVFTTDAGGRITYWNAAAERITGWSAAEALGKSCALLAGDVVNGCSCGAGPIRCGLALKGRGSRRCTSRAKDGRLLTIVKSAVPIRDAAGEPVGALESFTLARDVATEAVVGGGAVGLVGRHPVMQDLYRMVSLVADSASTVMIAGESGSGKDLIAGAIHKLGPRSARPLVRVACTILDALLDDHGGGDVVEEARGGTLLLHEVGDLSPPAQVKLLHALERRESMLADGRSGDAYRLICTTHTELRPLVDARRFRADLFFRLNVFPLRAPALREHLEDIPVFAEQILARRTPTTSITPEACDALMAYRWPGNVRELQNALEYAAVRAAGAPIRPEHLSHEVTGSARPATRVQDERAQLAEALARCGGNRTLAARALGISRVTLWKKLKKHAVVGDGAH